MMDTNAAAYELEPSVGWNPVGIGDFNGDGIQDILFRDPIFGGNAIWFMTTNQSGLWVSNPTNRQAIKQLSVLDWEIKGVADFNGDNKPDILWRYKPTGYCAVWFIDLTQNPSGG